MQPDLYLVNCTVVVVLTKDMNPIVNQHSIVEVLKKKGILKLNVNVKWSRCLEINHCQSATATFCSV